MNYNQSPEAMEAQAEMKAERAHADAMREAMVQGQQALAVRMKAQAALLNMLAFVLFVAVVVGAVAVVTEVIL